MNNWIYQGKELLEAPKDYYGFIYCITAPFGQKYWGKKAFFHTQKKKITKKVIKATKTRKRVERVQKDSEWQSYWGSSKELLQHLESGMDGWKKEIIKFCKDKVNLSFWETAILIENKVLFRDDCYNGNIGGKYFKGKIHG